MADYTELIKRLRNCASDTVEDCHGCPYQGGYKGSYCMNGLITEAADAIEELTKDIERSKDFEAFWQHEAEEALRRFQVAVANKPRWIPVTEEPPLKVEDDGYNGYLVFANGYYEVADYTTDKFDNAEYFHVNGEYEPDVTHWMPLPEPPKEEQT